MEQPFKIICPSCFASIKIKDRAMIGRVANCPECDKPIEIEDPDQQETYGIASSEPEEDVSPPEVAQPEPISKRLPPGVRETPIGSFERSGTKKKRRKKGDKLTGVRIGIHLICLQLIGIVLTVALLLGIQFGIKIDLSVEAVSYGILGLYLIGFSGKACCLSTPAESRGREVVVLAIVMEVIAFGLGFAAPLVKMPLLIPIGNFIGFAAGILFLWFLEELSGYLKRDDLADLASSCVGLSTTAFGIMLLLALMLLLFPITFVGFLMIVPLVMMVVVLVRYFTLIIGLRSEL